MADKSKEERSLFQNPVIAIMVVVLFVLIGGFAGNYYFINQDSRQTSGYLGYANKLKVLSQEIAKHAIALRPELSSGPPTDQGRSRNFKSETCCCRKIPKPAS